MWPVLGITLGISLLSGAALGAALGLTGFIILEFFAGGATQAAVQSVWNNLNVTTLSAIPLFLLLGDVLVASGLARGVYQAFAPFFVSLRGGLLHTNIAVCTVFGAVSGSSMAVAAAVGSVAYPELTRRGYDKATIVGSLAGGGTLGLLIPPSLSLLIYGAQTETSIGKLFMAGVLPGLMFVSLFMIWIAIHSKINTSLVPREGRSGLTLGQKLKGLAQAIPLLLLIFAVLGSLFLGIATPTEAAAVGVAAAMLLGFTMGDLTPRGCFAALMTTTRTFAIIAFILAGALIFAQSLQILAVPQRLLEFIIDIGMSKYVLLGTIVLLYLLLGCMFDGLSMMIMTLPIVFPLLTGVGFDPIWLGVIITIMIEVGMLTPPVGMNLFVLVGVTGQQVSLGQAAKASFPYWLVLLGGVVILVFLPGIATMLPNIMFAPQ